MKKRKWWKYLLPMVLGANVVLLIIVFSSAKTDEQQVIVQKSTQFTSPEIPETVLFAGEKMPIEQFDILEALDRELLSIAYFHSQTLRFIKLAPRYFSVIEPILKEYGIPDDFKYLAVAESSLDPRAVSPASAVGFWQFMRTTAKEFGLEVTSEIDERYHVEKSTHAACKYLLNSYKKYENWTLVAASYNRGITGIEKQLTRQKTENYYDLLLNSETQRYVFRIVALKLVMENPSKYNFVVAENEKYPIVKTKDVEINGKWVYFSDFAHEYGISYKMLKDFNPWLRENFLTNAAGKKYVVRIPEIN